MLNFHPIYLIFPLLLVFSCLFKNTKTKAIIITIIFIFTFNCAETGADYAGYKSIYETCLHNKVHGEIGFILICKIFNKLGISYNIFRIIFLGLFTILLSYSIFKLSNNFSFSFLIAYLMYIVYFVSAYRQFATMSILLFTIYLHVRKKQIVIPLLLNFVAIFIHKLAIIQFLIFLIIFICHIFRKGIKPIEKSLVKKYFFSIILVCIVVRILVYVLLSYTALGNIYTEIVSYPELSLINAGLISRLMILCIITYYYLLSLKNQGNDFLFTIYFISMLIYTAFPFELIMGRLLNNFKLLEIILIPFYIFTNKFKKEENKKNNKKILVLSEILLLVVICAVFTSQMVNQIGYNFYNHIFWR